MNTFFTSDQHYGHKNIIKYANRPFSSVEEMNEALIRNHNNIVQPDDDVWFLGDFAFMQLSQVKTVLRRLNGTKRIVLGNHDKVIVNNRRDLLNEGLLDGIYDYKEITVDKQRIMLFHYGARVWNGSHRGSWLLYGHSHGSLPPHGKSVDVGVDDTNITTEYRPYSFKEIKRFMDKREGEKVDHHG